MAVYEGVLHKISGGHEISKDPRGVIARETPSGNVVVKGTGYRRQAGFIKREFIQVGDDRIRNVMLLPYYDELLKEAVGKPVALSIDRTGKRRTVIAMRTPDAGVNKPEMGRLIGGAVMTVLMMWIAAVLIGLFLGAIGLAIFGTLGGLIGIGIGVFWAIRPVVYVVRTFRARAAI